MGAITAVIAAIATKPPRVRPAGTRPKWEATAAMGAVIMAGAASMRAFCAPRMRPRISSGVASIEATPSTDESGPLARPINTKTPKTNHGETKKPRAVKPTAKPTIPASNHRRREIFPTVRAYNPAPISAPIAKQLVAKPVRLGWFFSVKNAGNIVDCRATATAANAALNKVAPKSSWLDSRYFQAIFKSSSTALEDSVTSPARGVIPNVPKAASRLAAAVASMVGEVTPKVNTNKPPTLGPTSISIPPRASRMPTMRSKSPFLFSPSSTKRGSRVSRAVIPGVSPKAPKNSQRKEPSHV